MSCASMVGLTLRWCFLPQWAVLLVEPKNELGDKSPWA